jgi:predicted ABC-type ATPase
VVVIGGPNGAGKTTAAASLLPRGLQIRDFVNADAIASGLSAFAPERVAIQAGRIMLGRLAELARKRESFAFETTLASRSFAPFLRRLQGDGYRVHVIYIWLRRPELAVRRVAERVRRGGHDIPEEVIRRRYRSGLENFIRLFRPLADEWILCDNSEGELQEIARGGREAETSILIQETYDEIERQVADANGEERQV